MDQHTLAIEMADRELDYWARGRMGGKYHVARLVMLRLVARQMPGHDEPLNEMLYQGMKVRLLNGMATGELRVLGPNGETVGKVVDIRETG